MEPMNLFWPSPAPNILQATCAAIPYEQFDRTWKERLPDAMDRAVLWVIFRGAMHMEDKRFQGNCTLERLYRIGCATACMHFCHTKRLGLEKTLYTRGFRQRHFQKSLLMAILHPEICAARYPVEAPLNEAALAAIGMKTGLGANGLWLLKIIMDNSVNHSPSKPPAAFFQEAMKMNPDIYYKSNSLGKKYPVFSPTPQLVSAARHDVIDSYLIPALRLLLTEAAADRQFLAQFAKEASINPPALKGQARLAEAEKIAYSR